RNARNGSDAGRHARDARRTAFRRRRTNRRGSGQAQGKAQEGQKAAQKKIVGRPLFRLRPNLSVRAIHLRSGRTTMALKLRLTRMGSKKKPFYRIVAVDSA